MKKIIYILSSIFLTLYSCSYNSEDDLIDDTTIAIVTYEADVKSIIDNNCIVCHNNPPVNGAPMSLVTYDDVRIEALDNLINRISRQTGEAGAMPLGGPRLPQASIDLIQQWIDDGLLEE